MNESESDEEEGAEGVITMKETKALDIGVSR